MPHPTLDARPAPPRDRHPAGRAAELARVSAPDRAIDLPGGVEPLVPLAPPGPGRAVGQGRTDAAGGRRWPFRIEFSGSGSEYFRIWLVNAVMTLITLGAYHPRAQVRRYQYFRSNTWVVFANGERHAMDFEVDSGKSFRVIVFWMALIVASLVLYAIAPPLVGLVALVATPWLRLKSLRYRIVGTTFRGLRFRFTGDLRGYLAVWTPMLALGGIGLVLLWLASLSASSRAAVPVVLSLVVLVGASLWPWVQWRLARWRQQHLAYGELEADRFVTPVRRFYAVTVKAGLLGLLAAIIGFAAISLWAPVSAALTAGDRSPLSSLSMGLAFGSVMLLFAVPLFVGVYFNTALYNLAWGGTTGARVRLRSRLGHWRMAGLVVKSWVLTVLTLGLYRPFADIAVARLRLQAIDGVLLDDPEAIVARAHEGAGALGDLAADLLDVGDLL